MSWLALDSLTQRWVRWTGRRVDLRGAEEWLQGPVGDPDTVDERWLDREASRRHAHVDREADEAGLLRSLATLDGPGFAAADLVAPVRDFYERTSRWRLDLWVEWSPLAWPFGWLIFVLFARRLRQLALPLRSLDVAHGMTSAVTALMAGDQQVGALWLRRLRSTGTTVYSGYYDTAHLPGQSRPSVRVSFPLPNGRLVILLRPAVSRTRGLTLSSPAGQWGDPGAYLVVAKSGAGKVFARRVPVHEDFDVYLDDENVLRTDHRLDLWQIPVLRLHYRMVPDTEVPVGHAAKSATTEPSGTPRSEVMSSTDTRARPEGLTD